jgi:hypothetical protein
MKKFTEYLKLIMSMCLDCMQGGITPKTFIANIEIMVESMKKLEY